MSKKRHEEHSESEELRILRRQVELLQEIAHNTQPQHKLTTLELKTMSNPVAVGGTSQATLVGAAADGSAVVIDSTYKVSYSASNPSEVSFGPVGSDGSCTITGLIADAAGDQIVATVTRPDGTTVNSNIVALVITGGTVGGGLASVTLTLS